MRRPHFPHHLHHHVDRFTTALWITKAVLVETTVVMLIVLVLMILARHRRPRPWLDWAYIWKQFALWLLVALTMLATFGHWIPLIVNPWFQMAIWSNLGLAEIMLMWFIYHERVRRRRRK